MDITPGRARHSLARTVAEVERHISLRGWDAPIAVFALVRTAAALERDPRLARELPGPAVAAAGRDEEHLTAVEQEGLPGSSTLEDLLGRIVWPETVDGAAVVVERVVVPPEVEDALPPYPAEALAFLSDHPARQEVRLAAGVLRTGETWCTVRTRAHDSDDAVGGSPDLAPGLVETLRATLE